MKGALSDEWTCLSFTTAVGPRQAVILGSESRGFMTIFYFLRFEAPLT
jgi:hypothetical protein